MVTSTSQESVIGTSGATQPDIRHDNYDGSKDLSGTKMLEPETLNNAITSLLGQELIIGKSNPLARDFSEADGKSEKMYPVYLGSLDYDDVTERSTEVASTMPLVMDRIARGVCEQAITSEQLGMDFSSGSTEDLADELHMRLCSRPIDSDTQENVNYILEEDADGEEISTSTWEAVCVYFLLKQGSLLIN